MGTSHKKAVQADGPVQAVITPCFHRITFFSFHTFSAGPADGGPNPPVPTIPRFAGIRKRGYKPRPVPHLLDTAPACRWGCLKVRPRAVKGGLYAARQSVTLRDSPDGGGSTRPPRTMGGNHMLFYLVFMLFLLGVTGGALWRRR